ncbi:MAG: glycerol-3-phosphate dehydrogenase [Omnitrophica bacterium RIFCSPLOWO2_12_FULL_44_17]|uniref:Glycerol-3-phosphate dehydrogenase [NAD(P)+] n=1 Tax=Candidatus Danuiimicrobium aquiferis TaxID=1801832 RepID=A0A1G1L1P0_9BACT|nr:MAG: glycerol-3-phosphate dehydrogenase [Omnitrophica bacterium RIFCSPHIGHO2_02_FULL_45_28]OGW91983.1 MAG: glycerol-3-phosphate dehydrogenase [Omnitrophica bacterium RIFCSPHIGHO2_12_FULL_44_12]OGW99054.1 MAG: glycerol-3-phosphate dehydrogenase [Omnitrophica bacterium RIFCSPLOWO2_12_FULL_44_17]OGX04129.1 MAG: glycerol-3-phosphate dehydrogenase [Omnitrophica bacterium RIFCSPLOWO2_02_FULL_44_11]
MTKKYKVSILGDGGWGTALAILNARRENEVMLWSAFHDYVQVLEETRENKKFLPDVKIPPQVQMTSDIGEAVKFADLVVLAIPSLYLRNVLFKLKEFDLKNKVLVSVAKGIELKTLTRPSEIIRSVLGNVDLAVLSGPSHAEEVARDLPTVVVVGSDNPKISQIVQEAFRDTFFRVYVQNDVTGIELGGVLKNVIALGAGISDGLGFGANAKAALLTRGLLEMVRLGAKMGANPNTFFGLAGLGDLITTCISPYGRNLYVGREIGKGRKLKEILGKMEMVAEGVETARCAYALAEKYQLHAPIITEIYKMLYEDKDPRQAIVDLMTREAHEEMKQY